MRIKYVDIAKGIGIILVVFGHLIEYGSIISKYIFSFHMPLFFFLAGMTIKIEQYKNVRSFAKDKMKKLFVPFILFLLIGVVISLIIPVWRPKSLLTSVYEIVISAQPESFHVGQLWFLICLFWTHVLFFLIEALLFKGKFKYGKIIIYVFVAVIGYLIYYYNFKINIFHHKFRIPWKIDSALTAVVFFASGYYLSKVKISKYIEHSKKMLLVYIIILFGIGFVFGPFLNGGINLSDIKYNNLFYFYLAAFSGIALTIIISSYLTQIKRVSIFFEFIGKNSLFIFATHSFFLYLYAYLIGQLLNEKYFIMENIPLNYCVIGAILIIGVEIICVHYYNLINLKIKGKNQFYAK